MKKKTKKKFQMNQVNFLNERNLVIWNEGIFYKIFISGFICYFLHLNIEFKKSLKLLKIHVFIYNFSHKNKNFSCFKMTLFHCKYRLKEKVMRK